ncbi:MAG: protein phosphatase 2C domain-containing protein [Deferrisomatales bacterium]|nr:protein phosphatase 2C domain-containing protein [Deferrisomatales bacterium]
MSITIRWACDTRQGPRPRNEDSAQVEPGLAAAILADGMGGAAGGKEASALSIAAAVEFLRRRLPAHTPPADVPERLRQLVADVNRRVYDKSMSDPTLHGMGSTLVVLLTRGGRYFCVNVGDSRAYLLRGDAVLQISKDHSLVQERVDAGLITAAEVALQPDRNVLTRAIGTTAEVEAYLVEEEVRPGDVFILTSDGVHGAIEEAQFAAAGGAESPADAARLLVEEAVARGTRDNATAAVVKVETAAPEESLEALDQVLAYAPPHKARPRRSSGATRWLLAGAGLLLLATVLTVLSLR